MNIYDLYSSKSITSLDDVHAILTYSFEFLDSKYRKQDSGNYFPEFKLLKKEQNCLRIVTPHKGSVSSQEIIYSYNTARGQQKQNKILLVSSQEKLEEYSFKNGNSVDVSGIVSYSKHITQKKFEEKIIKNERVVSFSENKKRNTIQKKELSEFFAKYGLEIDFNIETYFQPLRIDYNLTEKGKKFKDVFEYEFTAKVKEEEKVNRLAFTSIGRGKSYGFGSVWVNLA
jgi:hypothetical protein